MSMRSTIGGTFAATSSALSHVGWWLDWHTRATPCDGSRGLDQRVA